MNDKTYYFYQGNIEILNKKQQRLLADEGISSDSELDNEIQLTNEFLIKIKKQNPRKINQYKNRLLSHKQSTHKKIKFNFQKHYIKFYRFLRKLNKLLILKQPYTFSPDASLKMLWDLLCLFFVIYEMATIPLLISFGIELSSYMSNFSTILFFLDILLNFNTGVYIEGKLKMERNYIWKEYIKFWFWIDFLSAFPYDLIVDESTQFIQGAKLIKFLKFLKFVKILRLIRLAKLKKLIDKFEEILQAKTGFAAFISFFKLFFFVLFFAHILGCIFHYIAQQEEISWLGEDIIEEWTTRYILSLYWGVETMTTIGYGDISPQTTIERTIGIVLLLIACAGFAFTMNSIGFTLQEINGKSQIKKFKLKGIIRFMKKSGISNQLQNKIRRYIEFVMDSKSLTLSDITSNLQIELTLELKKQINGKLLSYCNILLQNQSQEFLIKHVMLNMQEKIYNPEEIIFDEFDFQQSYDLFLIKNGEVDIFYKKTGIPIDQKIKHDYFGEISFFTNLPRSASAKSINFSNIFSINQIQYMNALKNYHKISNCNNNLKDLEQFHLIKEKIIFNNDFGVINVRCYICQMDDHIARDCQTLHFNVSATHFIQFLKQFDKLHQTAFFRKDRIDFHALKCKNQIKNASERLFQSSLLFNLSKKSYIEDLLNSYNLDEEQDIEEYQEPIYRIKNLEQIKIVNSIKKLNNMMTLKKTQYYSQQTLSEIWDGGVTKKIDNFLTKARLKEIEEKTRQNYFSCIPNFDKMQEYQTYNKNGNFTQVIKEYEKAVNEHFPSIIETETFFGIEEFLNYCNYYSYKLDIEIHQKGLDQMNFEQLRLLNMNRIQKKKEKIIKDPSFQVRKSLVQLKHLKAINSSFRNLFQK